MNKRKIKIMTITIAILLIAAFAIMLHQWIVWGDFWSVGQTLHHETFALVFISIAIGMIIAFIISRRK